MTENTFEVSLHQSSPVFYSSLVWQFLVLHTEGYFLGTLHEPCPHYSRQNPVTKLSIQDTVSQDLWLYCLNLTHCISETNVTGRKQFIQNKLDEKKKYEFNIMDEM